MPGYPSAWTIRAAEILADGKWHDYEKVVRLASQTVPPGRAKRKTEQLRLRHRSRPGEHYIGDHRRVERTEQELIQTGARAIVSASLSGSAVFEISPRGTRAADGGKRIRLIPGKQLWTGGPDD